VIALIPARGGSVRVPGKNIRLLAGHPLLAYTIAAALDSGLFQQVLVSTDHDETAEVARHYGAGVVDRPAHLATGTYPVTDRDWMHHVYSTAPGLCEDGERGRWALLRPTSPFRTSTTIRRAFQTWRTSGCDSLRAVERVRQHPGKMWVLQGEALVPLLPWTHKNGVPWHSSPTQSLPPVFVQNASLEMGYATNILHWDSLTGHSVAPFLTDGYEGFDINTEEDWRRATHLLAAHEATLPPVAVAARQTDLWGV
jgi:CMP-N,N'-diacetyllegionaminic acid synthase